MKMKAQEIHGMTNDELVTKLSDLKDELFNLRFQAATGQLVDTNKLRECKRDIARVKTLLTERALTANA